MYPELSCAKSLEIVLTPPILAQWSSSCTVFASLPIAARMSGRPRRRLPPHDGGSAASNQAALAASRPPSDPPLSHQSTCGHFVVQWNWGRGTLLSILSLGGNPLLGHHWNKVLPWFDEREYAPAIYLDWWTIWRSDHFGWRGSLLAPLNYFLTRWFWLLGQVDTRHFPRFLFI